MSRNTVSRDCRCTGGLRETDASSEWPGLYVEEGDGLTPTEFLAASGSLRVVDRNGQALQPSGMPTIGQIIQILQLAAVIIGFSLTDAASAAARIAARWPKGA